MVRSPTLAHSSHPEPEHHGPDQWFEGGNLIGHRLGVFVDFSVLDVPPETLHYVVWYYRGDVMKYYPEGNRDVSSWIPTFIIWPYDKAD